MLRVAMMSFESPTASWQRCLEEARGGSREAIGRLLEEFRPYLLFLAREELEAELQPKLGASDLVQDSLRNAHGRFEQFRGDNPEDLRGWLRQILVNHLANCRRHYRETGKRELGREVPLSPAWKSDASSNWLADGSRSPSEKVIHDEQQALLQQALDRLPEHYRQILIWRSLEQRPFDEIGRLMDRSPDAARMLWGRAVEALQQELNTSG